VIIDISDRITAERLENGEVASLSVLQAVIEHYMKIGELEYTNKLDETIQFIWNQERNKVGPQ
jgi:hypothetical protein